MEQASILDDDYVKKLGKFEIVYSWGVLHHTGKMWEALANAGNLVDSNGALFIAIYNTQPFFSKYWTVIKKLYNNNFLGNTSFASHIYLSFF